MKRVMRTGTVASVDNRNWEIGGPGHHSPPVAVARGRTRHGVGSDRRQRLSASACPTAPLLCVSDKPLARRDQLAGMAGEFYRQRVGQHLEIGLRALEKLKSRTGKRLHSRKLRSFAEGRVQ